VRAARCLALGPIEDVTVDEMPDPVPGPGEALVRVLAAGVNFPDALLIEGRYQVRLDPPFTPGSEFAGEVVAVGPPDVSGSASPTVGDLVCGAGFTGAFAELVKAPAASLTVVPAGIPAEVAAGFQVTYTTAFHALHTLGHVQAGEWVVVLGAAGGVGMATIDLARDAGARVLAAASTPEKLAACREAGADVVVDYTGDDLKTAIREATDGAHLVVDPVGGPSTEAALRALRPGGRLIVVGFASGEIASVPMNLVLVKGVSIHGLDLRHVTADDPGLQHRTLATILDRLATGHLHPRIDRRYTLDEVVPALQRVAGREAVGKVVVVPDMAATAR
jgi:NADPH:quinone reductase-like Zn-dependent oxidoreductase